MSTHILAIDPGTEQSAFVCMSGDGMPYHHGTFPNELIIPVIYRIQTNLIHRVVVEMVASYGMPVGREVFETVYWIGRFCQAAGSHERIYRGEVKDHLCRSRKANDAAIRQALLDRFGPGKAKAVGLKASPGPLYGIKGDEWAALAVAVTAYDRGPVMVSRDIEARC